MEFKRRVSFRTPLEDVRLYSTGVGSSPTALAPLSFENYRTLLMANFQYTLDNAKSFSRISKERETATRAAISATTTFEQLAAIALRLIKNPNAGFDPVKPLTEAERANLLSTMPWQYNRSTLDWYFGYANCGTVGMTYCFMRMPICSPPVAKAAGLTMEQTSLYFVFGGFGGADGIWHKIPYVVLRGIYINDPQNPGAFQLTLEPNAVLTHASLESKTGTDMDIAIQWVDEAGATQMLSSQMQSRVPARMNTADGCAPCIAGLGTNYWSYTDMAATVAAGSGSNPPAPATGTGWFDRQWFLTGTTNKVYLRMLQAMTAATHPRWLWVILQLDSGTQYMLVNSQLPTSPVKVGDVFKLKARKSGPIVTRFRADSVEFALTTTITVLETRQVDGTTFPIKYSIVISDDESKRYIIEPAFGDAVVGLFKYLLNWEGPATVRDESTGAVVGKGFLEANGMQDESQFGLAILKQAGISPDKYDLFQKEPRGRSIALKAGAVVAGGIVLYAIFRGTRGIIRKLRK